jgi:hypothetical protein
MIKSTGASPPPPPPPPIRQQYRKQIRQPDMYENNFFHEQGRKIKALMRWK